MQCQTYDMGRRCPQPATLASAHCMHHTRSITPPPSSINSPNVVHPVQQREFNADPQNPPIPLTDDMRYDAAMLDAPSGLSCFEPCEKCLSRICHSATRSGDSCRFAARPGRPWCLVHDPDAADERVANAVNAGRASGKARRAAAHARIEINDVSIHLSTRGEIQATLDLIIRLELLGRISPTRSRNILRALSIAAHNFDRDPRHFDLQNDTYQPPWVDAKAPFDDVLDEARENDAPATPEPAPARAATSSAAFIPSDSLIRTLGALARQNRP